MTQHPKSKQFNVRVDYEQHTALQAIYERDGVTPTEQIRRAMKAWIESRGLRLEPARRKAS